VISLVCFGLETSKSKQTLLLTSQSGGLILNQLLWLGLAQSTASSPIGTWNGSSFLIMSVACLFVLLIASRTINQLHVGPQMPLGPFGSLFNHISLAGFIASMSLGHIIGAFLIINFDRT
jgi:photosystem I subunit X